MVLVFTTIHSELLQYFKHENNNPKTTKYIKDEEKPKIWQPAIHSGADDNFHVYSL